MTTITGKTVLLTGASGGIGTYIARALAKEQATIIGVSRSHDKLQQVCTELKGLNCNFIPIAFDISQLEELPILLEKIRQHTSTVDILINNAGIEIYRAFQDYSTIDIQSVISTNLLAAIELSRLILPSMLERKSGHVVNIASLAAKKGHPYDSIYSASKAGLLMWSDAVRQELFGSGVQFSTICPGYISEQGMLANTNVSAPNLSGVSKPEAVARAIIKAIKYNQAEVIVNQDLITEYFTKFLLATWQFAPGFGDKIYQLIGVNRLNKMRIKKAKFQCNQILNHLAKK
jgi:short-subunit dehydrogenase